MLPTPWAIQLERERSACNFCGKPAQCVETRKRRIPQKRKRHMQRVALHPSTTPPRMQACPYFIERRAGGRIRPQRKKDSSCGFIHLSLAAGG